jgi:hypothetical protein
LVLSKGKTEKLLASASWVDARKELSVIVKHDIGVRLFGSGLRSVQNEILQQNIDKGFEDLFAACNVSAATVWQQTSELLKSLMINDVLGGMPERWKITLRYLGEAIEVTVGSTRDHIQLAFAARWKSLAVTSGLLAPLFCEVELASPPPTDPAHKQAIKECLCNDNAVVREMARRGLTAWSSRTARLLQSGS